MKRWGIGLFALLVSANAMAGNYMGVELQMNRLDGNSDGKISLKEYLEAKQKIQKQAGLKFTPKMATNRFHEMDTNGNGFLSRTELANTDRKNNKDKEDNPEKAANIFIKTRDADKDGRVSQKEYLQAAKRKKKSGGGNFKPNMARNKFDSIDQNGDGFITLAEVEKKKK